jgi:hypothetical protein
MTSSFGHIPIGKISVENPVSGLAVIGFVSSPGKLRPDQLAVVGVEITRLTGV